ncbi:M15 family metallopeptidase [Ideonella azotifigens]|uniref:M15 family metallopeptidase n=2 Tax=Ideonella azotifigens TaxID=513160 RepID=A0ABP3VCU7_9BURK|nr:M15 family metallopeptidase [Ideonella azotifigens]
MLLTLVVFFVLAIGLLALLVFPAARAWVRGAAVHGRQRGVAALGGAVSGARRQGGVAGTAAVGGARALIDHLRRRAWLLGGALALLVSLPLAAFWLRMWFPADSFDHTAAHAVDEHVAMLLQGEQLVPPPPLPPALFLTPEVEQAVPMVQGASRQWELLDDAFRQRLLLVFKLMAERHGYRMVLIEGYRSPERQAMLATMGSSVTLAGAGASYHQYGLAADCAFLRDGKIAISEREPWVARGYELYGEVAASLGMTWGGGWRSLKDLGHVELRRPGVLRGGAQPATGEALSP